MRLQSGSELVRAGRKKDERSDVPFIQPNPSRGTILKSMPWLPYSASTRCESLTASNFSGTTPLKSTNAVVILTRTVRIVRGVRVAVKTHMYKKR